jgi:hypothetical protein
MLASFSFACFVFLFVFTVKKWSYPTVQPPDKQAAFYELFTRKEVVLTFKINLPKSDFP